MKIKHPCKLWHLLVAAVYLFSPIGLQGEILSCFCGDVKFEASFLWWKTDGSALNAFVVSEFTDGSPGVQSDKIYFFEPSYEPGVRLKLATTALPGCWDINLSWTRYSTSSKQRYTPTLPITGADQINIHLIFDLPIVLDSTTTTAEVSSSFDYLMHQVDFGASKSFDLTCLCIFTPRFGFSFLKTNQTHAVNTAYNESSNIIITDTSLQNQFNGYGVFVGFLTDYQIFDALRLYVDSQFTMVYGPLFIDYASIPNFTLTKTFEHAHVHRSESIFKLGVGGMYETCFERIMIFQASLGWEILVMLDQIDYRTFLPNVSVVSYPSNLYHQGLTATVGLTF